MMGETVLKVKVPPVRIENSLSPLYRGTDFSTLAETFQTVWGGIWWITTNSTKMIWWKMTFCYKKFGGTIDSIYIWT